MIFGDKDQMNETDKILHLMEACRLCPRECDVNRLKGKKGFCGVDAKVMVARAALHMWEEPCISGKEGSGAVFFSGCSLGCGFCQNRRISRGQSGKQITIEHLVDIFLNLLKFLLFSFFSFLLCNKKDIYNLYICPLYLFSYTFSAALITLFISIAIVIGPTPPGTGVI